MKRSWDRRLPDLPLENVGVNAVSLADAWQRVSTAYLVRSVLVTSDRPVESEPFGFEAARCTVRDLLDALAPAYGLEWVQDERTGVAWLHPVERAYDEILSTAIDVQHDQFGLPMQSGILEPLAGREGTGIVAKPWGSVFRNTFDFAVDARAGRYSVRDVLNESCAANPTKAFLARATADEVFVTAVNLVSDETRPAPPGALLLWDAEIAAPRGSRAPTRHEIMDALAHPVTAVRHAARNYLESVIWSAEVEEWAQAASSAEQVLWTCIGFVSVLVRSEEATYRAAIELMEQLATDDFLAEGDPGLALVTALELARLTKDTRALEVVRRRNLKADELVGVLSDACRVAALSGYVREALQTMAAEPFVRDSIPLAAVIRSPISGKLEFELLGAERE